MCATASFLGWSTLQRCPLNGTSLQAHQWAATGHISNGAVTFLISYMSGGAVPGGVLVLVHHGAPSAWETVASPCVW